MHPENRKLLLKASTPGDLLLVDTTCSLFREAPSFERSGGQVRLNSDPSGKVLAGTVALFFEYRDLGAGWSSSDARVVRIFSPAGLGWVWAEYVQPFKNRKPNRFPKSLSGKVDG